MLPTVPSQTAPLPAALPKEAPAEIPGLLPDGWNKTAGDTTVKQTAGIMATGWKQVGGNWYYLAVSGAMLTGKQIIDGKQYIFSASGALTTGTPPSVCRVFRAALDFRIKIVPLKVFDFQQPGLMVDTGDLPAAVVRILVHSQILEKRAGTDLHGMAEPDRLDVGVPLHVSRKHRHWICVV